jgi:hypothetical protein
MKFISFETAGRASFGLLREDGIIDLGAKPGFASLDALIAAGAMEQARAFANAAPDVALRDARLAKPLASWRKCFCVGVNYPDRNAEYKDGSDLPKYPSLFIRFPESFTGPDMPLVRPPESPQLDYEGEIALVIGKAGRAHRAGRMARSCLRHGSRQRGHDPRLGATRQVQCHAGQELALDRRARPLHRHARRVAGTFPPDHARQRRDAAG